MSRAQERISSTCRRAWARVQKSDMERVGEMWLPPHLNEAIAQIPVPVLRAAALRRSPWSNKVMA